LVPVPVGQTITSEDLHAAADIVGADTDEAHATEPYGLTFETLTAFVDGSEWHDLIGPGARTGSAGDGARGEHRRHRRRACRGR
jgi:hypothetical protein